MSAASHTLSFDYAATAATVFGGGNFHEVPTFAHMMCELHVAQTLLLCPPYTFTVSGFDSVRLNKELYSRLSRLPEAMEEFVADCVREFQLRYGTRFAFGSVQMRPHIWVRVALRSMAIAYKTGEVSLVFPNGCCSGGMNCSINCFYALVIERMILPLPEPGAAVVEASVPVVESSVPVVEAAVPCPDDE